MPPLGSGLEAGFARVSRVLAVRPRSERDGCNFGLELVPSFAMLAKLFQQHHLKIFFSNKFVHTSVLDKVKASAQISVSSNSKLFQDVLGEFAPKNDLKACLLAGSLLAKRCRQAKVSLTFRYEPVCVLIR